MKIKAKILLDYIQKVSLNSSIMMLNLNFTDDGVKTAVAGTSNVAMTMGMLKQRAFEDYNPIGEVFIKNSRFLLDVLKTFDDTIEIEKLDEFTLKFFTDKREVYNLLADESICENVYKKGRPDIKTAVSLVLDKSYMSNIIKDMKLLTMNTVTIKKEGDKLVFQVGKENEYDYAKNIIICDTEGDAKVDIGEMIIPFSESVTDKFTLSFGNDMPIVLEEKTEYMEVTTYIAPIIEGD